MHHKVFVLGADGFVGRHIAEALARGDQEVSRCGRSQLELGNVSRYSRFSFADSIIVDCATRIDGTSEEVHTNNFQCLVSFVDYLKDHARPFRYVYFSTLATNEPDLIAGNVYVHSKHLAECHLAVSGVDVQIIKLSFPFGPGESRNRLVSRLITKVLEGSSLMLSDQAMSLMPIQALQNDIQPLMNCGHAVVQYYNTWSIRLEEVVKTIARAAGLPARYQIALNAGTPIRPSESIYQFTQNIDPTETIELMTHARIYENG